MLQELFTGIVTEPVTPDTFTEQMFEPKELKTETSTPRVNERQTNCEHSFVL